MLVYIPFLIDPLSYGVIALLAFFGSIVLLTIPVFATRGTTQVLWSGIAAVALIAEIAALITLGILINNGTIWS
jgi:hypothetical protein